MTLLIQFLLRASFGLAAGMALTSPREVTSGYFRNHLYVLLGGNSLAALAAWSAGSQIPWWPPLGAALLSYVGAVLWLYERHRAGRVALVLIAGLSIAGAWLSIDWYALTGPASQVLAVLDPLSAGLLLGFVLAAMFLGHWYLNTPTMALAPLKKLILLIGVALVLRAAVSASGLACQWNTAVWPSTVISLIALRWLAGIVGVAALSWMAWKTLLVPNTQSCTGILYVAVLASFLGELTSLLLHADRIYPF